MKILRRNSTIIILIILLILVGYAPLYMFGGFIGDFGDPIGQTIPNKFLLIEYIKNGILPLWNSFSFLGFPFLADIQVGAFYVPDIIIFSIFTPLKAHNISVLLHLIFAGIGTFFLLKNLTNSKLTALTLSITLVLTGSFLTKIVYLNFLETISFIPWILFIINRKKVSVPILSILTGLMIFSGHPVAMLYSFIIISIFFLFNCLKKWKTIIAGAGLGALLASIQIIPFLSLKMQSVRDSLSFNEFIEGSLRLEHLERFFTPFKEGLYHPFDTYVHFGTIAFIALVLSLFFFLKFNKKLKKIYLTGLTLCLIGILLSLGGTIPFLAKLLYEIPIINIIRVPARYILIFHFGAILALASFLIYILRKNKKLGIILSVLIVINSILIPFIFLDRHEIEDGKSQYLPEISEKIQEVEGSNFSINSTPEYFLSSSFFLFPNRHILSFMPNIIGYNPMILKTYYDSFPVAPVGAFENPNYLLDLYEKLEEVGLKYYIFPTQDFLIAQNLEEKFYITDHLMNRNWEKIGSINGELDIWKNPEPQPFTYFENPENSITKIQFQPGKIILDLNMESPDTLIVNQSYYPGWQLETEEKTIKARLHNELVQSYYMDTIEDQIKIKFHPRDVNYGLYLSLFGIIMLLIQHQYFARKSK